jgi:hypothetical protein
MMTDRQLLKFIVQKKRRPLSFDDYTNFLVLLLPLGFTFLGVMALYRYIYFERPFLLLLVGVFFTLFGPLFMYLSIVRLKQNVSFFTIANPRDLDLEQIKDLISDNFRLADIKVDKKLRRILAGTKMTAFSWGENITVVHNGAEVLVNSRPSGSRQPFTFNQDVKNIRKIRTLVEDHRS